MTQIKICGLSTPETVDAAVAAGATHIGLVFYAPSLRNLRFPQAAALAARVPERITRVGVFVDPDDAMLDAAVACGLDALQLHGREGSARVAEIRHRHGLPVWLAAGVTTRADIAAAIAEARGVSDLLLFDAKAPSGAALPGGNGVRFDWRLLAGLSPGMPWGLSGGLDAGNVGDAVRGSNAPLVDVSSGVEDAPGVKSVAKIQGFIEAVRRA